MPKDRKWLGYRHQVSMIAIAPSKTPPEPQKEDNRDNQAKEDYEIVEPAQAPPAFEEGSQATQEELQEVNLGSYEEPRPSFISGNMSPKEKDIF